MADLGSYTNTSEILKKYQFRMQKKYGQNFLIDANILRKIVEAAQITQEDCVLEIGPGIGTMTQYLAETAGQVIAVEIDRGLIPILDDTLSSYNNVTILCEDILKVDLSALAEQNDGKPIKVVANLPYYITTPIIMALLRAICRLRVLRLWYRVRWRSACRRGPVRRIMVRCHWRCNIMRSRRSLPECPLPAFCRALMWTAQWCV